MDTMDARNLYFLLLWVIPCSGTMKISMWGKHHCGKVQLAEDQLTNQTTAYSLLSCALECMDSESCNAVSYWPESNTCALSKSYVEKTCEQYNTSEELVYVEKECLNGGKLTAGGGCQCCCGYVGRRCEAVMEDCLEGKQYGYTTNSVYLIHPKMAPAPFHVFCAMDTGGTHISNHVSNSANFSRGWTDYKWGFGSLYQDFWLGLNKIHYLTHSKPYSLRFSLFVTGALYTVMRYNDFRIGNKTNNFRLEISALSNGNLTDCLGPLQGLTFSTHDKDNDRAGARNCAEEFQAGWWFDKCADCNPLGPLTPGAGPNKRAFWKDPSGSRQTFPAWYIWLY